MSKIKKLRGLRDRLRLWRWDGYVAETCAAHGVSIDAVFRPGTRRHAIPRRQIFCDLSIYQNVTSYELSQVFGWDPGTIRHAIQAEKAARGAPVPKRLISRRPKAYSAGLQHGRSGERTRIAKYLELVASRSMPAENFALRTAASEVRSGAYLEHLAKVYGSNKYRVKELR